MDDVPAGEVGTTQADAPGLDHRLGRRVADGVEPVLALLPGIDIAAQLTHLRRERPAGAPCGRPGAGQRQAAVAVAPSAKVEQHDQIAGPRQVHGVLAKRRSRGPPAGRHDHRGQLPPFGLGGIEPLGRQADVLAQQVRGFEADPLGRAIVARRGQALQRGGIYILRLGRAAAGILQRYGLRQGRGRNGERGTANPREKPGFHTLPQLR